MSLMRGQERLQDEQAGHAEGDGQQDVLCAPGDEDGEQPGEQAAIRE